MQRNLVKLHLFICGSDAAFDYVCNHNGDIYFRLEGKSEFGKGFNERMNRFCQIS